MAPLMRVTLLGLSAVHFASANPDKVSCNLMGTSATTTNMMTTTSNIMNSAPVDTTIGSPSQSTYDAGSAITWTVDSAKFIQGFFKVTAGTTSGFGQQGAAATQRTDCTGADAAAEAWYTAENKGAGIGALPTFTWTAPSDVCALPPSTTFYFIGNAASGRNAVNRHQMTLTGPAASTAVVSSLTGPSALQASVATTVTFATLNLLSVSTDTVFIKLVPSSTTCGAVSGISDAVPGGKCALAQASGATSGSCSITISASVAASSNNIWCYSAIANSHGCAYIPLTSNSLADTTAPPSSATVASTTTTTLQAGVSSTVNFVTTDLLTAVYDKAFVKIVASSTTCASQDGIGDAVLGGTCELTQASGATTSGTCSISITASVTASSNNKWCYSAAADNTGAYVALTSGTLTATTNAAAGASQATVTSTTTVTLQAGVLAAVPFVTIDLLTAGTDKAFIKIVPSSTTCGAVSGISDAVLGGTCDLAKDGGTTSGACTITITATVTASLNNIWCYSAAADNGGAYVALTSGTLTATTAAASRASVTSTTTQTLQAGVATAVPFVTVNLLTAVYDKAFIKIVPSSTTCGAVSGISDAILGGTCDLAKDGGTTSGTCTITITATVTASLNNIWCYSSGPDNSGAYVAVTSGTRAATTTAASRATVSSTMTTTLQASVATDVAFVTGSLLIAVYDKAFVKIVTSSTTCASQAGIGDAVLGGTCVLAQASGASDAGTCSITITASVTASSNNKWCYSSGPDNSGAYVAVTSGTLTATTDAPAGSSVAVVTSANVISLQAGVPMEITFVTIDLLTTGIDKAFVKIVASGTTCASQAGIGDAVLGGTCDLAQASGATSGTCTITITASVTASSSNKWCYSAAADNSGAYVAVTSGTSTATTAAASRASVTSTSASTLAAGNYVQVEFVCTDLLTAAYDRAFIKIVPAGGGGCATSGVGDSVDGGTCELAQTIGGVATAGACTMTIAPTVAASTGNEWCFHAGSDNTGVYQSVGTPSFAATTGQLMFSSADGAVDVWWSFPTAGQTFFTVHCKKVTAADGWCAFGIADSQPAAMDASSVVAWDLTGGTVREYDMTAQSDPAPSMLAGVGAVVSNTVSPSTKTFTFTCTNKIGARVVSATTNNFAWAYKASGGWGYHNGRNSAAIDLSIAPTSVPTMAPTPATSAPTNAPGSAPTEAPTFAPVNWSSADGAIDVSWSFPAAGKTFFTVRCKKVAAADGWCAFGIADAQPAAMAASSVVVWDLAGGTVREYDMTQKSDPAPSMLASVAAIESSNQYPGTFTFTFTCTNKIGTRAVSAATNNFVWAYKASGGWGYHDGRNSAAINLAVAPTSAPTKAPTAPTSAPTIAPGTVPSASPTTPVLTKTFDSPDGAISLAWTSAGGKTTFAVTCHTIEASGDGWCAFGISATSPSAMASSSTAIWDLSVGTLLEYDMTAASDPTPSMRSVIDGIESFSLSPSTLTFTFTCADKIGERAVDGGGNNNLVWAYKNSGGWGYHGAANRAYVVVCAALRMLHARPTPIPANYPPLSLFSPPT